MYRYTPHKKITLSRLWQILCFLFIIGFTIFFLNGIRTVHDTTASEQAKSLETAIRRSVVQCYAVEGTYPPSLGYLKEHYGLTYDTDKFYVDYTAIGSNMMPDITILLKSEQNTELIEIR